MSGSPLSAPREARARWYLQVEKYPEIFKEFSDFDREAHEQEIMEGVSVHPNDLEKAASLIRKELEDIKTD